MANGEWRMKGTWSGGSRGFNSYRDLRVWQDAMTIAQDCYALTRGFPREEAFGMTVQIRRSAVSVAANIAEGHGRENTGSFIQFLRMAQGSLKELETHLILSRGSLSRNGTVTAGIIELDAKPWAGNCALDPIPATQSRKRRSR